MSTGVAPTRSADHQQVATTRIGGGGDVGCIVSTGVAQTRSADHQQVTTRRNGGGGDV